MGSSGKVSFMANIEGCRALNDPDFLEKGAVAATADDSASSGESSLFPRRASAARMRS
jgi:hypothetical protein